MKAILLLVTASIFSLLSCSKEEFEPQTQNQSTNRIDYNLEENIKEAYFQNWISGVRGGGSGTDFYIVLGSELPKEVSFKYLYFRNKKSPVLGVNSMRYMANYSGFGVNMGDTVPADEGVRTSAARDGIPFAIGDDEALLEYYIGEELNYYLIAKPTEVESEFLPE